VGVVVTIPITPNLFAVSADDDHVRLAVIALVLRHCAGNVVTVATRDHPDGITLTVADPDPAHQPDRLYGAAFISDGREPDVALPVIAHDAIVHIHIW
jgi:hypothetical protein